MKLIYTHNEIVAIYSAAKAAKSAAKAEEIPMAKSALKAESLTEFFALLSNEPGVTVLEDGGVTIEMPETAVIGYCKICGEYAPQIAQITKVLIGLVSTIKTLMKAMAFDVDKLVSKVKKEMAEVK